MDVAIVLVVILGIFILREVIAWLLKTTHTYNGIRENQEALKHIQEVLARNGLR